MNRKHFLLAIILTALLMMSALSVSGKTANSYGIDPDEIDFYPNNPQAGMMVNLNYTPATTGCEHAAPSYLKPNNPARLTENIWFGQISGGNMDYASLLIYFETLLDAVQTDAYRLTSQAGGNGGNHNGILAQGTITTLPEGTIVQTTENYACLPIHEGVAMFWEVNTNGQIGWLMESIRWEDIALELHSQNQANNQEPVQDHYGPVIKIKPKGGLQVEFVQLQGNFNIQALPELSDMEAYYLTPHVYTPSEGVMGGTQLQGNDCDGTAPSRLTIGEKAFYIGHIVNDSSYNPAKIEQLYHTIVGYARFNVGNAPQMPFITSFPWNQTSLVELEDNTDAINELLEEFYGEENDNQEKAENEEPELISENNFLVLPIPVGHVIDAVVAGPLCTRRSEWIDKIEVVNGQIVDNGYDVLESFVWWQVNTNLLGMDLGNVWIAESITRNAPWGRVDYYLLTPDTFVSTAPNTYAQPVWIPNDIRPALTHIGEESTCLGILPSTLFAGSLAEPNGSALNLRQNPNGAVIGRVEIGEQITVYGESLCWGGLRWWQTSRGGWIAENNRTTALLLPAIQKIAPLVTESAQTAPIITTPEPTPTETIPPVATIEPTEEPTLPPRPTCEPITGANC